MNQQASDGTQDTERAAAMKTTGTEMLQTKWYGVSIFISHDSGHPEYWLVENGNGSDEYIGHMPPTAAQIEEFKRKVMTPKWND